ncbi:MAG: serine protease, partial [Planctomycetes bacterium]|nr:serine protease [Planctomycetota bacterium]
MRHVLRAWLVAASLLLTAVFALSSAPAAEAMQRDAVQRLRAATVMVYIEYAEPYGDYLTWGTGFVVGNGLIMTNAHVVREQVPVRIFVTNEYLPPTEARVIASRYDTSGLIDAPAGAAGSPLFSTRANSLFLSPASSNFDVALLAFAPPPGVHLPALSFSRDATPRQRVFAVGYPASEQTAWGANDHSGPDSARTAPPVITAGWVNQVIAGSPFLLMHDALCKTGNSGGPIVNARGEVLGMQTWSAQPDHRNVVVSFAISGRDLVAFLN